MLPLALSDTDSLIVPNLTVNEGQGRHMLKEGADRGLLSRNGWTA